MSAHRHAPIVTGKGKSRVVADARAYSIARAPKPSRTHREIDECRCARCVFVLRDTVLQLRALKWSYEAIGQALNRKHQTIMYHCKPELRAIKNDRAIAHYYATRPPLKRAYRTRDQRAWDDLGERSGHGV